MFFFSIKIGSRRVLESDDDNGLVTLKAPLHRGPSPDILYADEIPLVTIFLCPRRSRDLKPLPCSQ